MNLCRLKTVLFDLDGTLLDTAPDLAFALNQLLSQENLPPLPYEKIREVASDGSKGLLKLGLNLSDDHPDFPKYRENFISIYSQHLCVQTKLFPGMEVVLEDLEEHGISWGVVTNKPTELAKRLLTELKLASRSACIVGGNCTLQQKPHPDSLLLACKLTNTIPKECVYIGDAERDIEAAKYAGMHAIAALYGYLQPQATPEFWNADYYIDQPKDLLTWVAKQLSCKFIHLSEV